MVRSPSGHYGLSCSRRRGRRHSMLRSALNINSAFTPKLVLRDAAAKPAPPTEDEVISPRLLSRQMARTAPADAPQDERISHYYERTFRFALRPRVQRPSRRALRSISD